MTPDAELLNRYVRTREEAAVRELVARHIDFVFSAALRQVGGDDHFARDVAQQVFVDLLRKAPQLLDRPSLAGWLYTSTHFAAAKLVRKERRRQRHEAEAMLMTETSVPDPDWPALKRVVDETMPCLREPEREAILLRFFQKQPLAEVGRKLGVSENAAAKRVERALDALRRALARRGITSTGAALSAALTSHPSAASPPGLAATVVQAALAAAPAASFGGAAVSLMSSKTQVTFVAVLILIGIGIAVQQHRTLTALHSEMTSLRVRPNAIRAQPPAAFSTGPAGPSKEPAPAPPVLTAPARSETLPRVLKYWSNVGRQTPIAAFETFFWAVMHDDLRMVVDALHFDEPDARAFRQVFDELSEPARNLFRSPEHMVAAMTIAHQYRPTKEGFGESPGFQVIEEVSQNAAEATVRFRWNDGRVRPIPLRLVGGEWKLVVSGMDLEDPRRRARWKARAEDFAAEATKHGRRSA